MVQHVAVEQLELAFQSPAVLAWMTKLGEDKPAGFKVIRVTHKPTSRL